MVAVVEDFRNEAHHIPFAGDAIEDAEAGPYAAVSVTNALQFDVAHARLPASTTLRARGAKAAVSETQVEADWLESRW